MARKFNIPLELKAMGPDASTLTPAEWEELRLNGALSDVTINRNFQKYDGGKLQPKVAPVDPSVGAGKRSFLVDRQVTQTINGKSVNRVMDRATGKQVGWVPANITEEQQYLQLDDQVKSGSIKPDTIASTRITTPSGGTTTGIAGANPSGFRQSATTTAASPNNNPLPPPVNPNPHDNPTNPLAITPGAVVPPDPDMPTDPDDLAVWRSQGKTAYLALKAAQNLPSQIRVRKGELTGQLDQLMQSLELNPEQRKQSAQDRLSQLLNLVARQPFQQEEGRARSNIEQALQQRGLERSGSLPESLAQLSALTAGNRANLTGQAVSGANTLEDQLRQLASQLGMFKTQATQARTNTDLSGLAEQIRQFSGQAFQTSERTGGQDFTQLMQNLQNQFNAGQRDTQNKFDIQKLLASMPKQQDRGFLGDLGDFFKGALNITPFGNFANRILNPASEWSV